MNVAKEKLTKKRRQLNLLDEIPPTIETKSSTKKKRVCKRVRSSVFTAHCNEKDIIHPPLPVRRDKNKYSEYKFKQPKVLSHQSAPPNASYLKLTKSFFGGQSFATLRANILRSQKELNALDETCCNFEPQFTSTPNTSVNNPVRKEGLDHNIRKVAPRKLQEHHANFLKEKFGGDELAIQRISNFLTGESNIADCTGKPNRVHKEHLFEEPNLLEEESLVIDETLPDASLQKELSICKNRRRICDKCQHLKHHVNYLPQDPSEFQNKASRSVAETYSETAGDLFKGLPLSYQKDSYEISSTFDFTLQDEAKLQVILDESKSSDATRGNRGQEANSIFKDVSDVTGFNHNLILQPKILDDSFGLLWEAQAEVTPVPIHKIQHHKLHEKQRNFSNDSASENCPVCKTPFPKKSLDGVAEKSVYRKIEKNPKHNSAPPIHRRDLKKALGIQMSNFEQSETSFENLVRQYSNSSNITLQAFDDLWKSFDTDTLEDTLAVELRRLVPKAAKKCSPAFRCSLENMF